MDDKIDLLSLLLKVQDGLSNDDRHRVHFLLRDHVPRGPREDVTLAGTLNLIETLFDQGKISEDDLNFLIHIFHQIKYYSGAEALKKYQSSRRTTHEHASANIVHSLLDDNETDKGPTATNKNFMIPAMSAYSHESERDPIKVELLKPMTDSPTQNFTKSKGENKKLSKILCILCLYGILILQIIIFVIRFSKFPINKEKSSNVFSGIHQDVYLQEDGHIPENVDGTWVNHSKALSLTYADRLIRFDIYSNSTAIHAIKFVYSQNKSIEHSLIPFNRLKPPKLISMSLEKENLKLLGLCYVNEMDSTRLVGLRFQKTDESMETFGLCNEQTSELENVLDDRFFGYASGKIDNHLNGFKIIFYKICPLNSRVTSCKV